MTRPRKTRACTICGTRFKIQVISKGRLSTRVTCSTECQFEFCRQKRRLWNPREVQLLKELAESMPLEILVRTFNNQNIDQGFEERTAHSIKNKLSHLGYLYEPSYKYLGTHDLAKVLGVHKNIIKYWIACGLRGTKNRAVAGSPQYFTPENLRKFAREYMHFFGGFKRINLFFALEDQELVDEILTKYPTRYVATSHPKRVRCVETGQVFHSQGAAARSIYLTPTAVSRAINRGHKAGGYHFVRLDP